MEKEQTYRDNSFEKRLSDIESFIVAKAVCSKDDIRRVSRGIRGDVRRVRTQIHFVAFVVIVSVFIAFCATGNSINQQRAVINSLRTEVYTLQLEIEDLKNSRAGFLHYTKKL